MVVKPLFKPLGINFLLISCCFIVCACVGCFGFGEKFSAWIYPVVVTLVAALICFYKNIWQRGAVVFQRQLLLTTGVSWLFAVLAGSLPFVTVSGLSICDAIFESASGLTTTGASILSEVDGVERGILLWRAVSQWLGGLGFVVFFVTLVGETTSSNKKLYLHEATSVDESVSLFNLRGQMFLSLVLYALLTLFCAVLLYALGMSTFDAVCHALSTISTGGFSTHSAGITYYGSASIEWAIIVFMFLGGTNFYILIKFFGKGSLSAFRDAEFLLYFVGILVVSFVVAIVLCGGVGYDVPRAIRVAIFQVTSIATSTGFHSDDFAAWPQALVPLLMAVIFVGGCTGSTSGGFKIFRVIAICKIIEYNLEKIFRANIIRSLRIGNGVWSEKMQLQVLNFAAITFVAIGVSVVLLGFFEPNMNFTTLFSAICSSLSNVGPGLGDAGPTQSFHQFSEPAKLLLSALMLFGRLEFYALIVMLCPRFWRTFD